MTLALLAAALAAISTLQAQTDSTPPGEWIDPARIVDSAALSSSCVSLPWHGVRETLSETVTSRACRVVETGVLGRAGGREWRYALYRHRTVYAADSTSQPDILDLFPDTIPEDELVMLAAHGDTLRAVWHDLVDTRYWFPQAPTLTRRPEGDFLLLTYCLNGTGGCGSSIFRIGAENEWTFVRQPFADTFRSQLPDGWGMWKGIRLSIDSLTATAPVYVEGDANCCPSFSARLTLAIRGDSVVLAGATVRHEGRDAAGHTIVPGYHFGALGPTTSEAALRRWFRPDQVRRTEVYIAEGFCAPGTILDSGRAEEVEIAWADTARTRVAFVRVRHRPSAWRTVRGVTIGTTLRELVRLAGHPLTFQGFDWDYGGGLNWDEPVPASLGDAPGEFSIKLDLDSTSRARLSDLIGADPRANELFGDRLVRSDHPLLAKLGVEVVEMGQGFARPVEERECSGPDGG